MARVAAQASLQELQVGVEELRVALRKRQEGLRSCIVGTPPWKGSLEHEVTLTALGRASFRSYDWSIHTLSQQQEQPFQCQ